MYLVSPTGGANALDYSDNSFTGAKAHIGGMAWYGDKIFVMGGPTSSYATQSPGFALVLRLVQLAFAVLSLWGSLAISAMALDLADGRSAGKVATRRLPAALLVSIVTFAAVLLLLLPVPIALQLNGYDMTAIALSPS